MFIFELSAERCRKLIDYRVYSLFHYETKSKILICWKAWQLSDENKQIVHFDVSQFPIMWNFLTTITPFAETQQEKLT